MLMRYQAIFLSVYNGYSFSTKGGILVRYKIRNMCSRKSVGIIGGGLGGLASAIHLAQKGYQITIFDEFDVGFGGASAVAAGLLHPLTPKCNLIWNGNECFSKAINIMSDLDATPFYFCNDYVTIVRPKHTADDFESMKVNAMRYPNVTLYCTFIFE